MNSFPARKCISYIFLFHALLFPFFSSAQNENVEAKTTKIDSLESVLHDHLQLDIQRVELLNQLGYEYWIVDPNQSERLGLQAIELSKILPHPNGEAMANRVVGVAHWVRGNYELAFRFLFVANARYQDLSDSLGIANTLLNLGMVYQNQSNYTKAEENYIKAIDIFTSLNLNSRIATTQTKWGSMLISIEQYDEAYDKLIASLKIHESDNFLYGIAEVNNKLGELFGKKEEYNKALSFLLQSVEAGTKRSDHVGIADNYQRIGEVYMAKKNYDQALSYLELGEQLAETYNIKSVQKRLYFSLKELFKIKGNLAKSITYFDKYTTISNGLFNEEKANQIASMQAQHDFSQKEKELELAKQELVLMVAKNKANNLAKVVFFLVAILIGLGVWSLLRKKNAKIYKGEKALSKAKSETKELKNEIQIKEGELTTYTLNFVQKNELLHEVKSSLEDLKKGADIEQKKKVNSLARLIESTVRIDEGWDDFRKYFEATHQGLIPALKQKYPELSQNDLRLLSLIRINLSTKEISSMLGIAPESVKTARYRLRKKMKMTANQNIFDLLMAIESE